MAQPTGTFTATTTTGTPQLAPPESYVPDQAEVWRELARLINNGMPAPFSVDFAKRYHQLSLDFDRSDDVDAWVMYLGPEFRIVSLVQDGWWSYDATGQWMGRLTTVQCMHQIPSGDELVKQPAVQS